MKNQILTIMMALMVMPVMGQSKLIVNYQQNGEEKEELFDGIDFVRSGQLERYAWKPSSIFASNYYQLGHDYDISHVKRISLYVPCHIELPANAPITLSDVEIYGECAKIEVDEHGDFGTTASSLMALDKEGRLIYKSYISVDTLEKPRSVKVDAMETAIAAILPIFPGVFENTSDVGFGVFKEMLRNLDEMQAYAKAIDKSIAKNGYADFSELIAEHAAVVNKITLLLGLDKLPKKSVRRVPPTPLFDIDMGSKICYYKGIKLELVNSEWQAGDGILTEPEWKCTFKAANSLRFGYTAIQQGYKDEQGQVFLYDNSAESQLKYLVNPKKVSAFLDTFRFYEPSNWSKLKEFFVQPYEVITGERDIADMDWDDEKLKDIKFTFNNPNDVIFVRGAGFDFSGGDGDDCLPLFLYSMAKVFLVPVLKDISKSITKGFSFDFTKMFVTNLLMNMDKYKKVNELIIDNAESSTSLQVAVDNFLLDELQKYFENLLMKKLPSDILTAAEKNLIYDLWGNDPYFFENTKLLMDGITNSIKAYGFMPVEAMETSGDFITGLLGMVEDSYYINMKLDFDDPDPGYTIPDVPGHDF